MEKKSAWVYYSALSALAMFACFSLIVQNNNYKEFWIVITIAVAALSFFGTCRATGIYGSASLENGTEDKSWWAVAAFMLFCAFALRIGLALQHSGHYTDMRDFREWMSQLNQGGIVEFYKKQGFGVHPPGYMWVIAMVAKISAHYKFTEFGMNIAFKIPVMLIDLGAGVFIYSAAKKRMSVQASLAVMAAWVFNPAVLTDSALWGQVDVVYSLFLAITLYYITEKKLLHSYIMFAIAVLMKPQSFILTPVLIYGIIDQIFLNGFNKQLLKKSLIAAGAAVLIIIAVLIPFGFTETISKYLVTLQGSECYVKNAFNWWAMLGKNYYIISAEHLKWQPFILAAVVAFSALIYFTGKGREKVYISGAMLVLSTFTFSFKMNERYAYAAVILFLMAFVINPSKNNGRMSCAVTMAQFFNIVWVLFMYYLQDKISNLPKYSIISIAVFAYAIIVVLKDNCGLFSPEKYKKLSAGVKTTYKKLQEKLISKK